MSILSTEVDRQSDALNDRPERSALLASRRWSIAGFVIIGASIQVIASLVNAHQLTVGQALASIVCLPLVVIGILARGSGYLWLTVLGAASMVASNALPTHGAQWLFINSTALFGSFALGLVIPRRWIPVAAITCTLGLHAAWAANPAGVIATGFATWNGWIPPVQAGLLCIAANLIWSRASSLAREADREYAFDQQRILLELDRAERGRALRAAAIRIHESLLNEIRYVLNFDQPDGTRLMAALESMESITVNSRAPEMLDRLDAEVAARAGLTTNVTYEGTIDDILLDSETYEALCAALVEVARNRARHDRAAFIDIHVRTSGGMLETRIPDATLSAIGAPGIGLHTVISANLADVNGLAAVDAEGVTLSVPLMRDAEIPPSSVTSPFASGRSLMTFAVGSLTLTGLLYFIALNTDTNLGIRGWLVLVLATLGAAIAVITPLMARSLTARMTVLLALPALATPIALSGAMPMSDCVPQAQTTASALNVTGFMILCIGLWCIRRWMVVPLMAAWLGAVGWYLMHVTPQCGGYLVIPILNSVLIMPMVIIVVSIATVVHGRALQSREHARQEQRQSLAWSAAQSDVNRHLHDLVARATSQLRGIAERGSISEPERNQLRCTEALVRASVQVDPQTSGAFGLLAMELTEEAASAGLPLDVRALEVSADRTPVPDGVQEFLNTVVNENRGNMARLSAFTDGYIDVLTLTIGQGVTAEHRLESDSTLYVDGIEISIDSAQPELDMPRGLVVMATRAIATDADTPPME